MPPSPLEDCITASSSRRHSMVRKSSTNGSRSGWNTRNAVSASPSRKGSPSLPPEAVAIVVRTLPVPRHRSRSPSSLSTMGLLAGPFRLVRSRLASTSWRMFPSPQSACKVYRMSSVRQHPLFDPPATDVWLGRARIDSFDTRRSDAGPTGVLVICTMSMHLSHTPLSRHNIAVNGYYETSIQTAISRTTGPRICNSTLHVTTTIHNCACQQSSITSSGSATCVDSR